MNTAKLIEEGYTLTIDTLGSHNIVFTTEWNALQSHNQYYLASNRSRDGVTQQVKSNYLITIDDKEEHLVEIINLGNSDMLLLQFYVGEYRGENNRIESSKISKECSQEELDTLLLNSIEKLLSHPYRIEHAAGLKKPSRVREMRTMKTFVSKHIAEKSQSLDTPNILSQVRLKVFKDNK
ncbi:hypothetical protein OTK49_01260 [Vibrio coralliirubri]|uniref:hypothetical protein n=1 Tax=Vibrio coralliirubri TaxID=1516159 RepID=UPI00228479C9|nr:hypothetical protein [Vibrio coralliirubri]MCY9861157.1 hypothetical protein [Vibrio coralliirubri]